MPDGEKQFLLAPQKDDGPLAAYVFKTSNDRFVGTLNYFRIFSGSLTNESRAWNADAGASRSASIR